MSGATSLVRAGPSRGNPEYARERVYGIDFDARSIKIAKALNLIAGDGRTNVYRANTLDPRAWQDETKVGLRDRLMRFPQREEDRRNQEAFRYFDFDVLLSNPPFAGSIKDARMLHHYDLAQRPDGTWRPSMGRDILFIERNLEFLRPGGRMAIVLPQGRFNNLTDGFIREFIADKARVLGIVGLHANTFKPHTPTKTSVLLLQTWNEDRDLGPLCPRIADYDVFFAVSQAGGKDNAGNYIYRRDVAGQPVLDANGHLVVEHDLTEIAAAFRDFAERQRLSFGPASGALV